MNKLNEQIDYLGESLFYFAKREESNEVMEKDEIEKLEEVNQRSKSNTHRLDKVEDTLQNIYDLTSSVKEIAIEMKAMREDVNKIDSRVIAIEEKPGKNWENLTTAIVGAIAGAVVGYFFAKFM